MLTMTIRMWGASEAGDVDHGRVLLPISVNVELMTGELNKMEARYCCDTLIVMVLFVKARIFILPNVLQDTLTGL
jgi:hypothetical protein